MLKKVICVCEKLEALRGDSTMGVDVVVLMNHKELFRASNTAKVIEKVLGARIYIDGNDEDWNELMNLIEHRISDTVILFPSDVAMTWDQLPCPTSKKLIIVLDGTWGQARRLNQKLPPSIPRVKILPTTLSRFLCRRQTQADRVCTAEALALLMTDIGLADQGSKLESGLQIVVEGFNMQCYNSTHRPVSLLKKGPQASLPRHPDSLIRK
jgi:DTW domain-containing protein YfiP